MDYVDQLPSFDPTVHLTSKDLRDEEERHDCRDLQNDVSNINGFPNSQKQFVFVQIIPTLCATSSIPVSLTLIT